MRSIDDNQGQTWDVAVGRESYGMQVLLFFPRGGGGIRKALMRSDTRLDAQREMDESTDAELLERLDVSTPWEETTAPR